MPIQIAPPLPCASGVAVGGRSVWYEARSSLRFLGGLTESEPEVAGHCIKIEARPWARGSSVTCTDLKTPAAPTRASSCRRLTPGRQRPKRAAPVALKPLEAAG